MKTCYIFGAAEGLPKKFSPKPDDLVIAADAGFLKLKEIGMPPHIIVGDFDSLKEVPECTEVFKHSAIKDDTDTMLAVKLGLQRGFGRLVLYGCAGKRLDHTLANLQTLCYISSKGAKGYLCGDDFTATALSGSNIYFKPQSKGIISLFSATSECKVTLEGLKYPLTDATVSYNFPIGVSNEFTGREAVVRVKSGTAIIIWSGDLDNIQTHM
ncbi:MAG: thiamine diphosphokinase [Acutalibacteraceae bacterium]|jgi:thiamine pyrophosphokinase